MSILTGSRITEEVHAGRIVIGPFNPDRVGPNSVDLRLAADVLVYRTPAGILDLANDDPTVNLTLRDYEAGGTVLYPGQLYLGCTQEVIGSDHYVSQVDGRSGAGRKGLAVHQTAGVIDVGFVGQVVLELSVVQPLRVYAGARIAQVQFFTPEGAVEMLYRGSYRQQSGPTSSRMWRDFQPKE